MIVSVPDHCLSFYFTYIFQSVCIFFFFFFFFNVFLLLLLSEYNFSIILMTNNSSEIVFCTCWLTWCKLNCYHEKNTLIEPQYDKIKKNPAHQPSLIRVFAVHLKKHWVLCYPLSAQQRLVSEGWSESSLDAQVILFFVMLRVNCSKNLRSLLT